MGDIMNEMSMAEQTLFKSYMRKTKKQLSQQIIDMRDELNEERAKHIELQEEYGKACDYYKKLEKEVVELKNFINEHPVNVVKLDDDFKTDIISKLGDELCSHNSDHIVDTIGDIVNENEKLKQRISFQEGLSKKQTKCLMSKDREINKLTKIIEEHWGKSEEDIIKENKELKSENNELNYQAVNHTHGLETINTLKKHLKRYKYKCEIMDKIVKTNVLKLLHDYDELVDVDPACEDHGDAWDDSDDEDLTL
jgi:hypothetical protein